MTESHEQHIPFIYDVCIMTICFELIEGFNQFS